MRAVRRAADAGGFPDQRAGFVVEAHVLLGEVDVAVPCRPILGARAVVRRAGGLARDVHRADGSVRHAFLHEFEQRFAVGQPAVRAARHGDHLAVGARVGALGSHGVACSFELFRPGDERFLVEGGRKALVEADPGGDEGRVDLRGHIAAHHQLHIGFD